MLLPWRLLRAWALLEGVDSLENLVRCIANNYSRRAVIARNMFLAPKVCLTFTSLHLREKHDALDSTQLNLGLDNSDYRLFRCGKAGRTYPDSACPFHWY